MDQNKEKLITALALIALVLITTGISYAAFNYIGQGHRDNAITTGNLTFVYDEENKEGNGVSISNAIPTTDEEGKISRTKGDVFEFTVTASTKGAPIYYEIYTVKQNDSTLPEEIIKTYLTEAQGEEEIPILNTFTNKPINTYNKLGISQVPNQENGRALYQEMIPEGKDNYSKTFRYRMWIASTAIDLDESGNWKYSNMSFTVRVNVYASNEKIAMPTQNMDALPRMKSFASTNEVVSGLPLTTGEAFHSSEYEQKIMEAKFSDEINIPEGAISWDVSEDENSGEVMAWIVLDEANEGYILTIGGQGGVGATDLFRLFTNMINLKSISLEHLDTSHAESMSAMFIGCDYLENLDLSNFDTSNVTDMSDMFFACSGLDSLDLSSFDTLNVRYMNSMFYGCSSLTSLNLSNFYVLETPDISDMFLECSPEITIIVNEESYDLIRLELEQDLGGAGNIEIV